jgi:hypothetical protein
MAMACSLIFSSAQPMEDAPEAAAAAASAPEADTASAADAASSEIVETGFLGLISLFMPFTKPLEKPFFREKDISEQNRELFIEVRNIGIRLKNLLIKAEKSLSPEQIAAIFLTETQMDSEQYKLVLHYFELNILSARILFAKAMPHDIRYCFIGNKIPDKLTLLFNDEGFFLQPKSLKTALIENDHSDLADQIDRCRSELASMAKRKDFLNLFINIFYIKTGSLLINPQNAIDRMTQIKEYASQLGPEVTQKLQDILNTYLITNKYDAHLRNGRLAIFNVPDHW